VLDSVVCGQQQATCAYSRLGTGRRITVWRVMGRREGEAGVEYIYRASVVILKWNS
jgi:hypothetical protein